MILLLGLLCRLSGFANPELDDSGKWNVSITESGATLVGLTVDKTYSGRLDLPASVKVKGVDYPIKSIADKAFYGYSNMTGELKLPETLESIGSRAFEECSNLSGELKLPEGLKTIGIRAFCLCKNLQGQLVLPSSLVSISEGAFTACEGLTGELFLPSSVITQGRNIFSGCYGLTSIVIEAPRKKISNGLFSRCRSVERVQLPSDLEEIEAFAFFCCEKLTGLTFPSSLKVIGPYAFFGTSSLGAVTFPENLEIIEGRAFAYSTLTGIVTIPQSVTKLGERVFSYSHKITAIDLTRVSSSAFTKWTYAEDERSANVLVYLPTGTAVDEYDRNLVVDGVCNRFVFYTASDYSGSSNTRYNNLEIPYPFLAKKCRQGELPPAGPFEYRTNRCYPICLPFSMSVPTDITAYELQLKRSVAGNDTLVFSPFGGTELEAYHPYVLVAKEGTKIDVHNMENVEIKVTPAHPFLRTDWKQAPDAGGWTHCGTHRYIPYKDAADNGLFVIMQDEEKTTIRAHSVSAIPERLYRRPSYHNGILATFAYLKAPTGYTGTSIPVVFENVPTGIKELRATPSVTPQDIYTIDGRYVGKDIKLLPKGLYIVGGKKTYQN